MLFLIGVEIINGEREYRDWGVLKADNMGEAEKITNHQIKIENDDSGASDDLKYWTDPSGELGAKLHAIQPISDTEADVLQKYGIAYIINS